MVRGREEEELKLERVERKVDVGEMVEKRVEMVRGS